MPLPAVLPGPGGLVDSGAGPGSDQRAKPLAEHGGGDLLRGAGRGKLLRGYDPKVQLHLGRDQAIRADAGDTPGSTAPVGYRFLRRSGKHRGCPGPAPLHRCADDQGGRGRHVGGVGPGGLQRAGMPGGRLYRGR